MASLLFGFVLLGAGLCIYFAPTVVAKDKPHALGVFVVNLLFGWTMYGSRARSPAESTHALGACHRW